MPTKIIVKIVNFIIKRLSSLSLLNLITFCPEMLKMFIRQEYVVSSVNDITSNLEHDF
jgi:hypothetical protein